MHLAVTLALLCGAGVPAVPVVPAEVAIDAPREGRTGWLFLTEGRVRAGRIKAVDANSVTLEVDAETTSVIRADVVRGFVDREALGSEWVPYRSLRGKRLARALTADGRVLQGELLERGPTHAVLATAEGTERLEEPALLAVILLRERMRPVEARPRYLEAPSAFLQHQGELHLTSAMVVHLTGTYGATDWLAASAGSAIPALHASPYGANGQASARAGLELLPGLRAAGGLHVSAAASGRTAGFLSATATWAGERGHLSLHAGPMFPGANRLGRFGDRGLALAGSLTLLEDLDVVGEGWLSRSQGKTDGLIAAAGRYRLGRAALDLGAAMAVSKGQPFPWVGFTWDATP
jgi:hypothetical protein